MISLFKQFYAFIAGKALVEANNITLWKVTFKQLPTLYTVAFQVRRNCSSDFTLIF
jgi:hypothetical protein